MKCVLYISVFCVIGGISRLRGFEKEPDMKCILLWTTSLTAPFNSMSNGQKVFTDKQCLDNNCFITADRNLLPDVTNFNAILFHGPDLVRKNCNYMPKKRSPNQNYIFISQESPVYYPFDNRFDGFFNSTWTYKLNSDIFYGYMIIRNEEGDVIGPNEIMHWMNVDDMSEINDTIKKKLDKKTIAGAWFVSNCNAPNKRSEFMAEVEIELKIYGMFIDVYGKCGPKKCPHSRMRMCLSLVENYYYFYFAFENSFSEDYVTEKLLYALNHFAVPVVYGGANYTRFMPDGIYLNARELGAKGLAEQMVEIINDKDRYYSFFKWKNHYSYHKAEESPDTDYFCQFCNYLNVNGNMSIPAIKNFKEWWSSPLKK